MRKGILWGCMALLAVVVLAAPATWVVPDVQAAEPTPAAKHSGPAGAGFAGAWHGKVTLPGAELEIRVRLTPPSEEGGEWTGAIDIPQQGATGLPLGEIAVAGDSISFVIANVPGEPTFRGKRTGDKIEGPFSQNGMTLSFLLERGEGAKAHRPQDPKPPFPYHEEEVTFSNHGVTLAGTLTIPEGKRPFPAVVLLTGSGAENRNEEVFDHRPFLVIADHLSRHGVAVLRYDDRGVGGSSKGPEGATTEDFAGDALAAVAFLRTRGEIAPDRIGLLGHSEGALIGTIAASRSRDVAFLVFLGGPGVPGKELLPVQVESIGRAQGTPEEMIQKQVEINRRIIAAVTSGDDPDTVRARLRKLVLEQVEMAPEEQRPTGEALEQLVEGSAKQLLKPWFRFFLNYDPRNDLRKIHVPVLALNGGLDMQVVAKQNLPEVEKALKEGGNPDVTARMMPGLNHLFQHAMSGAVEEYANIDETISPEVLDIVTEWIRKRFAGG